MSDRFDNLRSVAKILDGLTPRSDARFYFEVMSGALIWTDEHPPLVDGVYENPDDVFPVQYLRGVWAYRSSLIRGKPNERARASWEMALELFPNWPGFLPERRDPKWHEVLIREEERAGDPFEKLDARWRVQQAASVPAEEPAFSGKDQPASR